MEEKLFHSDSASKVLGNISFSKSCIDMGWEWEVQEEKSFGWLVRTTFRRPDRDTGEVSIGKGRWWAVEYGTTTSGVVKTAWLACKQIIEHELHEAFKYNGIRIFDPHKTVWELSK